MQDYRALLVEVAKQEPKSDLALRLRPLLSSDGAMTEALANVVRMAGEMAVGLAGMDLVSEEGRFNALRQQGQVQGMQLALDAILRPLVEMEDNDSNS